MAFNWNDLRVFLAIADQGSIAGASRQLKQNHSTVFRRLNELEADLRTQLFERVRSGYVLTPAGSQMLEHSRDIASRIDAIERELAGQDLAPTGLVRMTTAPNIARTLLPRILKQLRRTHPGIVVEVLVGDSDYDLNRREADLALRATSRPPEHLVGRQVLPIHWWLCGHPRSKPLDAAALASARYIGADQGLMRLPAFQWLEAQHADRVVARASDLSTMAALAKEGLGLALLPSDQAEAGIKRLYQVPDLAGGLWLLTHPDLRRVQRIRAVWEAIVAGLAQPETAAE